MPTRLPAGFYRVLLVTWLLVVPLLAVWRTRGARRAERANLAVLEAAGWDGSGG